LPHSFDPGHALPKAGHFLLIWISVFSALTAHTITIETANRKVIIMWSMLLKDPVVWGSLLGIFIVCVMMAYYTYMFIHNSGDDHK
jgi:magnesium-transporting ATPase (P-type)